jgi:hypothetical protein
MTFVATSPALVDPTAVSPSHTSWARIGLVVMVGLFLVSRTMTAVGPSQKFE